MRRLIRGSAIATLALALVQSGVGAAQQPQSADAGVYAVVEIEISALIHDQLDNISARMVTELGAAQPTIHILGNDVDRDVARVQIARTDMRRALRALRSATDADLRGGSVVYGRVGDAITARLTPLGRRQLSGVAKTRVIEILRRRLDPDGDRRLAFENLGDARLLVSAHGIEDPAEMVRLIGPVGALTFNLVDGNVAHADVVAGRIPAEDIVAKPYPGTEGQSEAVRREPLLAGSHLAAAFVSSDVQTGAFELSFQLDAFGARAFCAETGQHVDERFAILLDKQVITAPRINDPICGGSGRIVGDFTPESASQLALLLRAGALPAPVRIVEEGIGPSPPHE